MPSSSPELEELTQLPQMDSGAPCPIVVADEHSLVLGYYLADADPRDDKDARCLLVKFCGARAHLFGPPNDEALSGHPLHSKGLTPYAAFEVHNSAWIRSLQQRSAVHPQHNPATYDELRHFIFTFHDSTFECVARYFESAERRGEIRDVLRELTSSA